MGKGLAQYLRPCTAAVNGLRQNPTPGAGPGLALKQPEHMPRDAMHLAVMSRLGIDSIVTTDDDFLPVNGLALFTSNPRILSPH